MEVTFTPLMGDSYNAGAAGSQLPTLYLATDYTDAASVADFPTFCQFQSAKEHPLTQNRVVKHVAYPKPSVEVFINAVASGYQTPAAPRWCDSNYASIPHYSTRVYVRNFFTNAAGGGQGFRIQPTLYFRVKEVR